MKASLIVAIVAMSLLGFGSKAQALHPPEWDVDFKRADTRLYTIEMTRPPSTQRLFDDDGHQTGDWIGRLVKLTKHKKQWTARLKATDALPMSGRARLTVTSRGPFNFKKVFACRLVVTDQATADRWGLVLGENVFTTADVVDMNIPE